MADGVPITVRVMMPDGLDAKDFQRSVVMRGLRNAGNAIRRQARTLLNRRGEASKPGEFPARQSGAMVRALRVIASKRKDRYWVRVQINKPSGARMFYPAALMYGSAKRNIQPRADAVWQANDLLERQNQTIVQDAMRKALKGWL